MSNTRNFYLWLGVIGVIVFLTFCLAFSLWLELRPRSPTYNILFISIEQPSTQNENGTIAYTLEIQNPNMDSTIYYDDTTTSFLYGQQQDKVADTTIRSFRQGSRKKSRVESRTVNANPGALKNLLANAISNKTAELKVTLMTRVRYKTWGIKSKFHKLNMDGILLIGSDGKLKLTGKKKKYKLKQSSKRIRRFGKHKR